MDKQEQRRVERLEADAELLAKLRAHPDFVTVQLAIERHLPRDNVAVRLLLQLLRGT
jgi:hypothetical protein